MIDETVTLVVDGMVLGGFQEVNITWSRKDAALSFAVKATNPSWDAGAWALRQGKPVEIYANCTLMLKGVIDKYEAEADAKSREVRVNGRSKSAKAVDSQPVKHKTGRIEKKTLLDAAKELDEVGVGFSTDQKLSAIPLIQRGPAESIWQTLDRYARSLGLFLSGQPDGTIKITKGGEKRHAGGFIDTQPPVKKISVVFSQKDKRSPIVNRSQRAFGTDAKSLRQEIKVYDETVGDYRPAVIFNEPDVAQKELKDRAEWQRLRQNAAGANASFTVAGWRDSGGTIWTPGHLIYCQYPIERLDQDMMVESVTFTQNISEGTTAKLTMIDPVTAGGKRGNSKSDKAWNPAPKSKEGFAPPNVRA